MVGCCVLSNMLCLERLQWRAVSRSSPRCLTIEIRQLFLEEDNIALVFDEPAFSVGSPAGDGDRSIIVDIILS